MVRYLMKQILIGVKSLHDYGIIHRDLKLGNILLNYHDENDRINQNIFASEIKIIDFNVSYFPNDSEPKTVVGTIPNMAPSIIKNGLTFSQNKEYDDKIDIWSLGTLCYEMLFGKPLFDNKQNHEIIYLNEDELDDGATYYEVVQDYIVELVKKDSKEAKKLVFKKYNSN